MPLASVLNQLDTNPLWRAQYGSLALGVTAGDSEAAALKMPESINVGVAVGMISTALAHLKSSVSLGLMPALTGAGLLHALGTVSLGVTAGAVESLPASTVIVLGVLSGFSTSIPPAAPTAPVSNQWGTYWSTHYGLGVHRKGRRPGRGGSA